MQLSPGNRAALVRRWIALASVGGAFAFCAIRLLAYVDKYAVNVFFLDDWAYLGGLFDGWSAWRLFTWQHGPHGMGLGLLLLKAVLGLSRWSSRAVAFTVATIFLAATALALWLKRRIAGSLSPFDAAIPLLFLALGGYETWSGAANPAHGPLPLLMAMTFALLLTVRSDSVRALGGACLGATAVYTGFAIFLALVALPVFALEAWHALPNCRAAALHLIALVITLIAFVGFFRGYRFMPAVDCFVFPHPRPFEYVRFVGLYYLRPLGTLAAWDVSGAFGIALALGEVCLCAVAFRQVLRRRAREPLWLAILVLSGFSLLFGANAAVGRVCLGVGAAVASRYVPYATTGLFAAYLAIAAMPRAPSWPRPVALSLFLGACIVNELGPHADRSGIQELHREKAVWRDCYRRTHQIEQCDRESGMGIYPRPAEVDLKHKLDFLERQHLNLFAD